MLSLFQKQLLIWLVFLDFGVVYSTLSQWKNNFILNKWCCYGFQWHIVVMQLTIQANLCSVTVAVMEPRFCVSFPPVRGKECLWLPTSDWGDACWPISCPVSWTTGRPETRSAFSVPPFHFHLTEKLHTTFPGTEGKTEEWRQEIPIQSLFVMGTWPVRHFRCQLFDTWPPAVINSSWLLTHDPAVL